MRSINHLRLHVNGDNTTFGSDQPGEFEREETHSRPRLNDRHAHAHEGLEHPGGILREFADELART